MLKRARSASTSAGLARAGFTLVELLIALALGSAALAAGISLLSTTLHLHGRAMRQARMNQDLRQIINWMQRDLSRAGSWGVAGNMAQRSQTHDLLISDTSGSVSIKAVLPGTDTADAAFAAPLSQAVLVGRTISILQRDADGGSHRRDLRVTGYVDASTLTAQVGSALASTRVDAGSWTVLNPFSALVGTGNNCLVFSYDEDSDGVRGPQEAYGWRFSSSAQSVQMVNNTDSCSAGSWENVSDERSLRVITLTLITASTTAGASALPVARRQASFVIAAQLRDEATADRSLRATSALRNDALQ